MNKYPELYQELKGISKGAYRAGVHISTDYLIAWNSYMSLYSYFKEGSVEDSSASNNISERCSAFIATGSATENHDIIMGHTTHSDFATAQLCNIIMYIVPTQGLPFVMQMSAGYIASVTDWFICASGIIGCETTISQINYTPEFGSPFFCRIRKAMQYGKTLDHYTQIMLEDNAGDYACSWLLGNINTNEIMLFEIGLKTHDIKRTMNGIYYGMNSAIDYRLRTTETSDNDYDDISKSTGARNYRLNYLLNEQYNGKLNIKNAKDILSDHYDVNLSKTDMNTRSICKHSELDGEESNRTPFYPFGCTDAKVVNSKMAKELSFVGRFGSACGRPFSIKKYVKMHPEYKDWEKVIHDMPSYNWHTMKFIREYRK